MLNSALEEQIDNALSHLSVTERADLVRIVSILQGHFLPERIYIFGSQARGTAGPDSDVDVLVVVRNAGEFPHHLAQQAYRVVGQHTLPLEIVFMTLQEFDRRAGVISSLPATVLKEGMLLYAASET